MAADPETDALHELPPAYQQAIRSEVRDVLAKSGQQVAEQRGWTKRDVLKAGGYVTLGALLGGGGLYSAVEPAQAAPTGELGTTTQEIDKIFADEIGTSGNPITTIVTDLLTLAGDLQKESGSPYTATGASSANSINPSGLDAFDIYLVYVKATDQATNAADVELQVDGETGTSYFEIDQSGTRNTSQNEFGPIMTMASGSETTGRFLLFNQNGVHGFTNLTRDSSTGAIQAGSVSGTWPPSQFTLKRGQDTDWEVQIAGYDL